MQLHKIQVYAVSLLFIFNGCLFGTWAAKVPFFKQQFSLDEQSLSGLLLVLALGAVISFPLAGRIADKYGIQVLSKIAYLLYPLPFIGLALSGSMTTLTVSLFLFGFLHGAMDVGMNSWAAKTEALTTKKLMPFFHAMFSLGAGAGAILSVFFIRLNITTLVHFLSISMLFVPMYYLLKKAAPLANTSIANTASQDINTNTNKLPWILLTLIGFIAFSSALGEGAVADWSAVVMRQEFGTDMSFSGWAYAVFSLFMVLSRLLGHFVIERLGTINTARGCALFSITGAVTIITVTSPYLALFGFALLGIGYSVIVPIVFSKAAQTCPHRSASAIAFVAIFAYGGMLFGPVAIGLIGHLFTLKVAFILLAVLPVYSLLTAQLLKHNET